MAEYKQHKYNLNLYPKEWEKLKQISKEAGMETSSYVAKKVFEFIQKNGSKCSEDIERDKSLEDSKPHTLVCSEGLYQVIKTAINENGMKLTRYILNIVLS